MATSSAVSAGQLATATQYNNLRTDVLSTHTHDGTDGNATVSATTLDGTATVSGVQTHSANVVFNANADISFAGTTGTNDIVLTNALADALSVTDGSADIIVVDTSTSGNVITFTSALTVGVDDTGHDVQFFGATAGAYMLWDESADDLIIAGAGAISIDATTDATNTTSGSFHTDGGAGIAKKLYVGTDLDVDGTSNLDAVDIDGAVQADGTITVGVDDTGYDVKLFGATSGQFVLWDESADELVLAGDTKLSFHDAAGGENIIASADGHLEINAGTTLDITAPTVDLNSSTEFNIDTAIYDLNASGAVTVNSSGGTLSVGNDNVDQAINIATGGTRTLTLGVDDGTDLTTVVIKGPVFIGDTANAEMTRGLTINQGAADDMTFVLKSSDINHGMTTLPTGQDLEVDDWMTIQKNHENVGGVRINAIGEVSAEIGMQVIAFAGPPTTSDTSASRGVIAYFVVRHDGSNGYVAPATDSNGYSWGVADGDGNYLTKMLLKADDGELHLQDTTLVALDTEDDILVTRGLQKASGTGFIDSIYDKHNPFNDYDKLRELKLVGPKDEFGDHLFPLQPRLTLHEGALWQLFEDLMSVVVSLPEAQKNCLNPRLKSRLLALEA